MERVVVVVGVVMGAIAYVSSESASVAVVSGLFWAAIAYGVVWLRGRVGRVRRKAVGVEHLVEGTDLPDK